jgi:peptidoglycan/xylan/chitin deacetylase (PgdA/CDA1 family)
MFTEAKSAEEVRPVRSSLRASLLLVCTSLAFTRAPVPPPTAPPAPRAARDIDSLRVPILVYHNIAPHHPGDTPAQREFDVPPEVFEWQMSYLRRTGTAVVSLERLVAALEGRDTLPARAVVITFDDGWETQFIHGLPVLRRFGYTATFFVFTQPIGRNTAYMTWNELRELIGAGMTIGSHSRSHPLLTRSRDRNVIRDEVEGSREVLERSLGVPIDFFAYPYGAFTPAIAGSVRHAGYRAARSLPGGTWNSLENLWGLRAVEITEDLEQFRRTVDAGPVAANTSVEVRPAAAVAPGAETTSRSRRAGRTTCVAGASAPPLGRAAARSAARVARTRSPAACRSVP